MRGGSVTMNFPLESGAIAEYLAIGPDERAIQSLPMHYSYGLSVLNSHLVAGAAVVITPHSFMRPEFWRDVDEQRATSFAGVPYMYETLRRLRFDPARHPSLRTLTQGCRTCTRRCTGCASSRRSTGASRPTRRRAAGCART
jgi:acyl-coenzyme A synthetase/AMP-(fatty) acid ligase